MLRVALKGEFQLAVLRGNEAARTGKMDHALTAPRPSAQPLGDLLLLKVVQTRLLLFEPTHAAPAKGGVFFHQPCHPFLFGDVLQRATPILFVAPPLNDLLCEILR